jgi:hypothetical protein
MQPAVVVAAINTKAIKQFWHYRRKNPATHKEDDTQKSVAYVKRGETLSAIPIDMVVRFIEQQVFSLNPCGD